MKKRIVIAFGGNAIDAGIGSPTAERQKASCEKAAKSLLGLIKKGHEIIISHGNGPQVGVQLLQNEASDSEKLPAMPLDSLVANTEGLIGYWLQNAIYNLLQTNQIEKNVFSIVTQVLVDKEDKAFKDPTKFIGPFYTQEEAKELESKKGYKIKADSNRGYRRVVPSPQPIDILEKEAIQKNLEMGHIVIAVGGGGIPVIQHKDFSVTGVEAVIDKDHASRKLAELIHADIFLILTGVDFVAINFGTPAEEKLTNITVDKLKEYIKEGQFPAGSMLPKVQAAIEFVESKKGRTSIITSLEMADKALEENIGTKITS